MDTLFAEATNCRFLDTLVFYASVSHSKLKSRSRKKRDGKKISSLIDTSFIYFCPFIYVFMYKIYVQLPLPNPNLQGESLLVKLQRESIYRKSL